MIADEITWLLSNLQNSEICPSNTQWYLFGSVLEENKNPADLDLLIIYEHPDDASLVRSRLCDLETQRPLDLIFMTVEEEHELDFIRSENCIQIFPENKIQTIN